MMNDESTNQNHLQGNANKAMGPISGKLAKRIKKLPPWMLVTLIAFFFLVIFCMIPIIVIDVTKQWCNLFPDFFNSITPGICP